MQRWEPPLWFDRLAGIGWRTIAIASTVALLVFGLLGLSVVIVPILLALLFACGLSPVANALRRIGASDLIAALISVLVLLAAISAVAWLTVRAVVDQWDEISLLLHRAGLKLADAAADDGIDATTAENLRADLSATIGQVADVLIAGVLRLVPTVAGVVASLVLSLFITYSFLKDGPAMWAWIIDRFGSARSLVEHTGERVWGVLSGFVLGQTAIAAIDATLIAVGARLLGVPQPMAIFVLTLFGAYVPFIGAFLSGMVAVLLAIGDADLATGAAMLLVVLVVQAIEGNFLQPWIQGRALNLHPLVIALAVALGGAFAGILGVLLAVPLAAAAFVTLAELKAAGLFGPAPAPEQP